MSIFYNKTGWFLISYKIRVFFNKKLISKNIFQVQVLNRSELFFQGSEINVVLSGHHHINLGFVFDVFGIEFADIVQREAVDGVINILAVVVVVAFFLVADVGGEDSHFGVTC